jgi:inosine-uridine nucleoside N-ribohydrolase
VQIHLDTDFAGDTDDAAALALLLGRDDVEVVGITTVADPDGARAGYVESFLALAGRHGIPCVAGAGASLAGEPMGDLPDHDAYWGALTTTAQPGVDPGAAIDLTATSIEQGATVVGIGPYTNLALLERARPRALADARVVLMGGWVRPRPPGFPPWGPERDWNAQCDVGATTEVFAAAGELTLATLPGTIGGHLRAADLVRLRASGPMGALLARQAEAHAAEYDVRTLGRAHPALPDDLMNFQWDPVACAIAVGWDGARIERMRLRPRVDDGVVRFEPDGAGREVAVVTEVDGDAFSELWLRAIERLDASGRARSGGT